MKSDARRIILISTRLVTLLIINEIILFLRLIFFLLSIFYNSLDINLCEVISKLIATTLNTLIFFDSAIKAYCKVYRVYKLTRYFELVLVVRFIQKKETILKLILANSLILELR